VSIIPPSVWSSALRAFYTAHSLSYTVRVLSARPSNPFRASVELSSGRRRLHRGGGAHRRHRAEALTFARHDEQQGGRVPFAESVTSSLALFGRQFEKDDIRVEQDVPEDLPPVGADSSRLCQVVLNMVSNAHQSLKSRRVSKTGKLLRISARRGERDFVRAVFYDSGIGIRREDLERLFDPFYTTRRDSGGTGLGHSSASGSSTTTGARSAVLIGLIDDAAAGRLGAANDSTDKESARQ
jgi:hypothetical protein